VNVTEGVTVEELVSELLVGLEDEVVEVTPELESER